MATHHQFNPSVTVTLGPAPAGGSSSVMLPPVDGSTPAVVVQNVGGAVALLFAGESAGAGSLAGVPGVVTLQPGETRFFATHPGFGGGTVASLNAGAQVTFSRGAVSPVWLFPAAVAAVF